MAGFNIHPYTTVIEIADIVGAEEQFYQVIIGYDQITTFVGCTDAGNSNLLCPDNKKSLFSGDSFGTLKAYGTVANGCDASTHGGYNPGNEKIFNLRMTASSFIGSADATFFLNEVDTNEIYHYNDGYKNIKFTELCKYLNPAWCVIDPALCYNLSSDVFTNIYGDGFKILPHLDIWTNAVTSGPGNVNSIPVHARCLKKNAAGTTIATYNGGGSSNAFNDPCAMNSYLNTQNIGGFGLSSTYINMDAGDTLHFQIRGGDSLNANASTKLCDGVGLGLSQDPANCITGMGTRISMKLDFTGTVSTTGTLPAWCDQHDERYISSDYPWGTDLGLWNGISHGQPWIPEQDDCNCDLHGMSLYFKHNDATTLSSVEDKKQETIVADIIQTTYEGNAWDNWDYLYLKGDGSSSYPSTLQTQVPKWYGALGQVGVYDWYTSNYQHSGLWDTSGAGFKWKWDSDDTTSIISYEEGLGSGLHHEVYSDKGALGTRNWEFWKQGFDCYQVTIDVASLTNCRIKVHEGTATNPALTPTNPADISAPGVYVYCLAALAKTGMWASCNSWTTNGAQNFSCATDGSVMHSSGNGNGDWFHFFAAGGIKILTAQPSGSSGVHECVINNIEIVKMQPEITTVLEPIYGGNYTYEVPLYDWEQLDVLESKKVPLALTFQVGDLKDITKRTAGFSKTFNLPASAHNNQILKSLNAVGVERKDIGWKKGRIKANGIVVFNGLMRIEQGVTGKGGYYKCHIIEDTIDWAKAIGDKELCDITILQPDPQPKSRDQVIQSWSQHKPYHFDRAGAMGSGAKYAEDYFWGLASYGEWHRKSLGLDYKHDVYDFHPVIYTRRMVIKIFEQSGYSLSSKFWDSVTASLLCHPFGSGEDYYQEDPSLALGAGGSHLGQANHPGGPCGGTYDSGGELTHGASGTWYPKLNVTSDYSNNITGTSANKFGGASNKGYVVPFDGQYDITIKFTLHNSNSSWANDCRIWGYGLKNGTSMGTAFTDSYWGSGSWPVFTQWGLRNLVAGDIISFKVVGENYSSNYSCWQDCENIEILIYPTFSSTPPPQLVEFSKVVSCGTKQIDYLKGLTEMFNLQWTADEESKTVYCEPYDDFFGSGKVLDWSDKLDITSWSDKFIVEELAKKVKFEYAEDSGDTYMNNVQVWMDNNGYDIYKSHTEQHEEKFRKEELNLGTEFFARTLRFNNYGTQSNPGQHPATHPYAPNGYGWGDMAWKNCTGANTDSPCMPIIWMEDAGTPHINGSCAHRPPFVEYPSCDMRILNYYSLLNGRKIDETGNQASPSVTGCTTWNFYESNDNTIDYFPHMNWINDYQKGVGIDPYNLSWGEYDDGMDNVSPGLFQKYWHTAYQKMNGGAALRTCKMNLTPNDIAAFDYRDLIFIMIDGVPTYWTVNKIKDYKPNQEVLTVVELIEWKNAKDFAHIIKDKQNSARRINQTQTPINVNMGVNTQSYNTIQKNEKGGVAIQNNSGNISSGGGIALGHGVVANSRQTVVGNYNTPNQSAIFQVGSGSGESSRKTAFEINSDGEVEIHGGALVVQESDGVVHELLYDDEIITEGYIAETKVKKVYLKKEAKNTSSSGGGEEMGGGY